MIKLIVGLKGTGKTKTLITATNAAMVTDRGCVVCIEKGRKLIYDISHKVRLISSEEYDINTYDRFYGFLCGLMSANYDITDIFVDSITKICGDDMEALEEFLAEADKVIRNINITITLSKDANELSDELKKYL